MSPNIYDMRETKYVSQNDVDPAVIVTIVKIIEEDVSLESEPADVKWTARFKESIKPLVLNWTNLNLIAAAIGSEKTEDWIGKQIVLWRDKSIMFKGELKGGIRVRAVPQQQTAAPPIAEQPITNPDYVGDDPLPPVDDGIPY